MELSRGMVIFQGGGGFWRIKKSDWRERSSYGENPLMGV